MDGLLQIQPHGENKLQVFFVVAIDEVISDRFASALVMADMTTPTACESMLGCWRGRGRDWPNGEGNAENQLAEHL
jgi:hypothetical protein